MRHRDSVSAFGQADPTDGRDRYDWKSKYSDPVPKREIFREAFYLGALLFGFPAVMVYFWLGYPNHKLQLTDQRYTTLVKYVLAWSSGSLGGVLFSLKWLYHSVARGRWHLDRRLWRIFTPHISGALASITLALVTSGWLRIFDREAANPPAAVVGLGFLVGYFSDSAIAKLAEIAENLFGTSRPKEKHADTIGEKSKNQDNDTPSS